jgi:protein-disulfide isomerase/uncharacterized membrane protein
MTASPVYSNASTHKPSVPIYLLNLIGIIGFGFSIQMTRLFYDIRSGAAGFRSFCNISATMNCDSVALSRYAELFLGIPLSSFAGGWFLAFFLVSLFAHIRSWRRESVRALFALSLFGVGISLFYMLIMALELKTFCLLCLGIDVLTIGSLFILYFGLKPEKFSTHKPDLSQLKTLLAITVGSVIVSVVFLRGMASESIPDSDARLYASTILNSPAVPIRLTEDLPSIGPATAPITIVEFSDFQCPYCRMGALTINALKNRYPDKVQIVFKNFPLNQSCNSAVEHTAHPAACEAARTAECASRQGQFEPAYEKLFEAQSSLAPGKPLEIAKALPGIDAAKLENCILAPETDREIQRDVEEARVLGIKSTPTFFINGHKMEGAYPLPVWNHIIDQLLKQK